MALAELEHEDYSKRERILNALSVYPERYRMSNQVIADLAEASTSYVYQLRTAINEGELSDDEFEAALDSELQSQYRDRIDDLLNEHNVTRTIDDDAEEPQLEETGGEQQPEEDSEGEMDGETLQSVRGGVESDTSVEGAEAVSVAEVERVRDTMEQYRTDAEFERERFQGEGKDIAEGKYYVANRAVEMLDQVLSE